MLIGVPLETAAGEARVAVTPETAKKLRSQGHQLFVQAGAGIRASAPDTAYAAVGAEIVDAHAAFHCDLVLKVRPPAIEELALMRRGATLVGMLNPFDRDGLERLANAGVTGFALEAAPHHARAEGHAAGASMHPPAPAVAAAPWACRRKGRHDRRHSARLLRPAAAAVRT